MALPKIEPVKAVSRITPWVAPIPTAWLVYNRTIIHLGFPWPIALAAAIVVEFTGLTAAKQALELYSYNRSRLKTDPKAPTWIPVTLLGLYVLIAIALTVILDTFPFLASYAPAIFPPFSVLAFVLLALQLDHDSRKRFVAKESQRRKEERQAAKDAKMQKPSVQEVQISSTSNTQPEFKTKKELVLWLQAQSPNMDYKELAKLADCDPSYTFKIVGNGHRQGVMSEDLLHVIDRN